MNVKRVTAKTSRAAMMLVRQMLGDDAVILSNRSVAGGVEILAAPGRDLDSMVDGAEARKPAAAPVPPPEQRETSRTFVDFARALQAADSAHAPATADARGGNRIRKIAPVRDAHGRAPAPPADLDDADSFAGIGGSGDRADTLVTLRSGPPVPGRAALRVPAQSAARVSDAFAAPAAPHAPVQAAARAAAPGAASVPPSAAIAAPDASLARELTALRKLVEGQLSVLSTQARAGAAPHRTEVRDLLEQAGFSAALSARIADGAPAHLAGAEARQWIQGVLVRNLACAARKDDLIVKGGAYALVGPTGVGKTTTAAKLAARAVLRHGADRVALISADNYRIGAQDQLDWYARMLGVDVQRVRSRDELAGALEQFAGRHLVLIDTAGMSQRDGQLARQMALLEMPGVVRIPLLNAAAQPETLEDVLRAYGGNRAGQPAIVTKLDEAVKLGGVLDCAIRHKAVLQYVGNGQRVPEDLHAAHGRYLVDKALRQGAQPRHGWTSAPSATTASAAQSALSPEAAQSALSPEAAQSASASEASQSASPSATAQAARAAASLAAPAQPATEAAHA